MKPTDVAKIVREQKEFGKKYERITTGKDVRIIVKRVRTDMYYNSSNYAYNNATTKDNETFLRGHMLTYIKKDKKDIKIEYFIWFSNSQSLRARRTNHFFIDGTFDVAPFGFSQLITILTNDVITNYPKPLAYILLSSKDEEAYSMALKHYKDLLT